MSLTSYEPGDRVIYDPRQWHGNRERATVSGPCHDGGYVIRMDGPGLGGVPRQPRRALVGQLEPLSAVELLADIVR